MVDKPHFMYQNQQARRSKKYLASIENSFILSKFERIPRSLYQRERAGLQVNQWEAR